jgi:hypothetical protein
MFVVVRKKYDDSRKLVHSDILAITPISNADKQRQRVTQREANHACPYSELD